MGPVPVLGAVLFFVAVYAARDGIDCRNFDDRA